jgi:2,4-dienoyl-CoA reductase (NADPH2)
MSDVHHLYPNLFSPLDLHGVQLANRVLMGSMHTNLEEQSGGFKRLAAFYALRAEGEAGLIVTGGISPNKAGAIGVGGSKLTTLAEAKHHRVVPQAVHAAGGKICMQILHAGRYAYHPDSVAPSALQSPITPFKPTALTTKGVEATIRDFVRCAELSAEAGYDGVEIMGSEGYLLHQFVAARTNQRTDKYGGTEEARFTIVQELITRIRETMGNDKLIIFRLSMLDLVPMGSNADEILALGKVVREAGASMINTGIGWHESRVPTIASVVPRGAFAWVTATYKDQLGLPVITTNRINDPVVAEQILASGQADMVSMARPFLADPFLVRKARTGKSHLINTCIACNQACLDHVFENKPASCIVNPFACRETEWIIKHTKKAKHIVVIGGGMAGLAAAATAAERGHQVTLIEASSVLGGQFQMALRIPGKEEYGETVRYFTNRLAELGVNVVLNQKASLEQLQNLKADVYIVATGVTPRLAGFEGELTDNRVISYAQALAGTHPIGHNVAIIGAGGIGFDMAVFVTHGKEPTNQIEAFNQQWGIDSSMIQPGSLVKPHYPTPEKTIWLLQRSPGKPGQSLGKTTGWIHKQHIQMAGVQTLSSVVYLGMRPEGLAINHLGEEKVLPVDQVIVCAGQEPRNELFDELKTSGLPVYSIGGAANANGLDAKRAIKEGVTLTLTL